jgi:site-specific DNA-methyltransferase (adenine-specific)
MIEDFIDKIITGDALEIMKQIPDNTVDVSFIDPPFNLIKSYNSYKDNKGEQEYLDWSKKWILEMIRITKPTGSIFIHNIPKWLMEYYRVIMNEKEHVKEDSPYFKHLRNLRVIDWIVWNEPGSPKGRYLYASHYGILYLGKSNKTKFFNLRIPHKFCRTCHALLKDYGGKKAQVNAFGTILSDVWDDIHRYKHRKRRDSHPNQLPEPLMERILLMSADEGDLVLDPMVGVGTTCIASKKLGMHYIGIDMDDNYCKIAREKLSKIEETKINGAHVSIFMNKVISVRNKDLTKILESTEHITLRINSHGSKQISTGRLIKKMEKRKSERVTKKYTFEVEDNELHQKV